MVTEGIIKVGPKHYGFPPSVLQLRCGLVIAEICIRNSGAVVFRNICNAFQLTHRARLTNTSPQSGGRGLVEKASILLVDGLCGTTGEKLQENGRSSRTMQRDGDTFRRKEETLYGHENISE